MSLMDANKFYKTVEEKKISSLYFFFGEESYLIRQATEQVKNMALEGGIPDFNYDSFYAYEAEVSRIRDVAETLPMMAARRVVVLKEAQELTDKEWQTLEPLITNPVDTTVFIINASKIDKRKKHIKALTENGACVEFKRPYENQMPQWISYIAQNYQLTMTSDAITLLHRLVGNHLTEVDSEIHKLYQYLGDKKRVDVEDVARVVSKAREESVFDLTRSIAMNDRAQALMCLVGLLDQGQSEIGIVSLIARHIRILIQVHLGLKQGHNGAQLAQYAQIPSYFLTEYLQQSKYWTLRKLENTLLALNETDRALKSSPLSSHIWLENFILKTCKPAESSASLHS